ncbi:MAG TPA: YSC84-related protein [Methylophaga sp.]|nr:YSC84-related protein [Methylophaga sp.]
MLTRLLTPALLLILSFMLPVSVFAATAAEIDIKVDETLKRFKQEVPGGDRFLAKAKGVLVFPNVIKAGFGIGGEYGEGALRIGSETVAYYNTAGASIGFQLGVQSKSLVIVFLEDKALDYFRSSKGWEAGVDGSVAVIEWGVGEDINTINVEDPIVGFMFGNKGLMFNLTLEGSKFTRISK